MSHVIEEIIQEHKGKRYRFPIGVKAENVETDENHQFVTKEDKKEFTDSTVNFTPAETRTNIKSGEKLSVICGKIYKYFADLKAAAWQDTTDSITSGKDADVTTRKAVKAVDEKFGDMKFEREGDDIYVVYKEGADTVRKKLGNSIVDYSNVYAHAFYPVDKRDIQKKNGESIIYGNISEYDLTMLPEWQKFVFGENIIAQIASHAPAQSVNQPVGLLPHGKLQHNVASLTMNAVTITDFMEGGIYAPELDENDYILVSDGNSIKQQRIYTYEEGREHPGYFRYSLYALYVQSTGKLYIVSFSTGYSYGISLYKI